MSEEWTKRCGLGASYRLALLPEFSIADGGVGHDLAVFGECAEDLQRTQAWGVALGFGTVSTTGRLLPDPVATAAVDNRRWQGMLEWREGTRRFGHGPRRWYTRTDDSIGIGVGRLTTTPRAHTIAGETIQRAAETFSVLPLMNLSSAALVFEPTARIALTLRAGLGTSTLFPLGDAEYGHFSRTNILAFVGLDGAFVDNMSEHDATALASSSRIARGVVSRGHGFVRALVQYHEVSGASATATKLLAQAKLIDPTVPSTAPETADLSLLLSLQTFLEDSDANLFLHSPAPGRWGLASTDAAVGLAYFVAGADGNPGAEELYAGGFRALFALAAKLPWTGRITDAPDGRLQDLPDPVTEFAVATIPATAASLLDVVIPAGSHQLSDGLGEGAFAALTARLADPDPMESGAVVSTTYSTVSPGSVLLGRDGGSRGSVFKAKRLRWMGESLELRVSLTTPFLQASDGLKVLDIVSGQPKHQALPSTNRAEVSAIVDLARGPQGSVEFRAGAHLAQQYRQADTSHAVGAQLGLGGYLCMGTAGRFCLGTEATVYGSIGRDGGAFEIPIPTVNLRFHEN